MTAEEARIRRATIKADPVLFEAFKERQKIATRKYRAKNPDKISEGRIKLRYGISISEYQDLYNKQEGQCAICKTHLNLDVTDKKTKAHIDHNHTTGEVRGLLCNNCNAGIGFLQDSALVCKLAADYLSKGDRVL
jgi:Recombination endonuclease VII